MQKNISTANAYIRSFEKKHEVHVDHKRQELMYEKAFLSPETDNNSDFCMNTAAWD